MGTGLGRKETFLMSPFFSGRKIAPISRKHELYASLFQSRATITGKEAGSHGRLGTLWGEVQKNLSVSSRGRAVGRRPLTLATSTHPSDAPVHKFLCLCLSIKLRLMSQRTDEKFKREDARRELRTASVTSIA